MANATNAGEAPGRPGTANERFKRRFGDVFWSGIALAALLHGAAFAFFPKMASSDVSFSVEELQTVDLPPEVDIPPPPEAITRPATPVIGNADIGDDVTIPPTTFEENPVNNLPPPPTGADAVQEDIGRAPVFTPMTEAPRLMNKAEVERALERNYPGLLRDAGIGGVVKVWFKIDEDGRVLETVIMEPSGYPALDDAALKVAGIMEFSPAYNRDRKVQVWVEIPVRFSSK